MTERINLGEVRPNEVKIDLMQKLGELEPGFTYDLVAFRRPERRQTMTELIEDEDGAPYPQCKWCGKQVKSGGRPPYWVHIDTNRIPCAHNTSAEPETDHE